MLISLCMHIIIITISGGKWVRSSVVLHNNNPTRKDSKNIDGVWTEPKTRSRKKIGRRREEKQIEWKFYKLTRTRW